MTTTKKDIINRIKKNDKVIAAARGARTAWRLSSIIVPAAATAYLLVQYDDIIITVLAVLLGLYSFSQLIKSLWLAELNASDK